MDIEIKAVVMLLLLRLSNSDFLRYQNRGGDAVISVPHMRLQLCNYDTAININIEI
jgi:hypothetical protein